MDVGAAARVLASAVLVEVLERRLGSRGRFGHPLGSAATSGPVSCVL